MKVKVAMPRKPRKKQKSQCFVCWLAKEKCVQGTLSGCCVNCSHSSLLVQSSDRLCNKDMGDLILRLAKANSLSSLDSDPSSYSTITVRSTSSKGVMAPHCLEIHGCFTPSNTNLVSQFDDLVSNYAPEVDLQGRGVGFVGKAILIRGYLCALFSETPVVELDTSASEQMKGLWNGTRLRQQMMNFMLGRLDGLLQELLIVVRDDTMELDAFEASTAAAIVYLGLLVIDVGLGKGNFRPIFDGQGLQSCLHSRLTSISEELMLRQKMKCVKIEDCPEHILTTINNLRSSPNIRSMTLELETCYYPSEPSSDISITTSSTELTSSLTSPSELSSVSDVSLSLSPELQQDFDIMSQEDFNWQSLFPISGSPPRDADLNVSATQAPKDSGYLGLDQWNNGPSNRFTWSQY